MPQDQPGDQGQEAQGDEAEVSDDDVVIRGIPQGHIHPISDNKKRVSKGAFSASSEDVDPEKGMSVDLWSKLLELGIDPESDSYLAEFEVLMTFSVSTLRHELGLEVVSRPITGNAAHCNVLGVKDTARKPLLRLADWLRRPDDVYKSQQEAEADEN